MAKLATLGLSDEQAEAVAGMLCEVEEATATQAEAVIERSRAKTRDRVQKWRDNHKSNVTERYDTLPGVTKRLVREPAHVEDKTSNLGIDPQKEEIKKETRGARSLAFEQFWLRYPNKVGKPKARTAFEAALSKADLPAIMAGLDRYIIAKPADRAWMNPATFLNQERWDDRPAPVTANQRAGPVTKASPVDHFRNYASEINGQDRDDRGLNGHRDDAPGIPVRAIEHHR